MRRNFLFLFLICLVSFGARAQFIFQNIRWQDGLSAKEIRCLYKDDEGFLWIGTSNGLNCFDGAIVKQYRNNANLRSLYINSIHPFPGQDSFLVGTIKGMRIFNRSTGTFREDARFSALSNENIFSIKPDDKNRFWIATGTSIYIYANDKLLPVSAVYPAAKVIAKQGFYIAAFLWDNVRKGFWIGGQIPYFFDCNKGEVYYKENNPFHYPALDITDVYTMALDSKNNLWYGCNKDVTLNFWDCHSNKVDTYHDLNGKTMNVGCNRLFVDSKDRLWISTWAFAAYFKEPGKEFKKIPYSQNQRYTIGYGHFRDVIEDKDGAIWLGTINGVSKRQENNPLQAIYKLPSFEFYLETGFANAHYISIDGGQIIACKEEGVIVYNMNDGTYTRYAVTTDPENYLKNRFVMAAKAGTTWWFAGADGVYYLEKGSQSLVKFNQVKKGGITETANFIFVDSKSRVWFHVIHDALYRYDPLTRKCDRFDGKDAAHGLFEFKNLSSFVQRRNNNLLFSISNKGLLSFDITTEQFSVLPVCNPGDFNVANMAEDKNGDIWLATNGRGMLKIKADGRCVDSINSANGLLLDQLNGVAIDDRGYVWGTSREGLMYFNPATKAVTRVDMDLGQTLQDYWNNITIANKKVYAVMLDHVVEIDPFRFVANPVTKAPHITSVKVFGVERPGISNGSQLEFAPNDDYITFQFASLNHRDIPSLQYSFQLEGYDKDWVNSGRTLTASYNNLAPGHYTFKVRSTDENGQWMKEITRLKFYVAPQWWQTWWFAAICMLLVLALLLTAYRNFTRRKQKKEIERTIDYFANSVYGDNSVNEICWDIARNCISQLQFEDCVVYLLNEDRTLLVQKAAYGPKNPKEHEISNPIEIEVGKGIVGTVAATGKPLIIKDTTKDSRYIVDDEQRMSEIAIPILHEGKVIGVVDSEHRLKGFFTEDHAKALSTIASISANKIAEAQAEAQAQEKEIKLLEINKLLAESQLMALRAQMNPHFVFNCLNSIQECIVTQKYGEASKYLNKFAKLFRLVLNNSGKNLVTIGEEKEVLDLYLELELMRFEHSFSYAIMVDEGLDMDDILLPSMLLQPYVENALWHGLMHKTGERNLEIAFKRISDDVFQCTIEDNGIGRTKALALKAQKNKLKQHESKGMQISSDRLDVLQRQGHHASINILDKYNEAGEPIGTKVIIELSIDL